MSFTQQNPAPARMTYRVQRDRGEWDPTSALEDYADGSIVPYLRAYQRHNNPNHDYSPRVATAVRISNHIDLIEASPNALDQIIWGSTHAGDCHPGVRSIVNNPVMIDLLLIRHFKIHGGIALPPLPQARESEAAYQLVADREAAAELTWTTGRTMVHYPVWQGVQSALATPGLGHGAAPPSRGRGGGNVGRGAPGCGGRGRGY